MTAKPRIILGNAHNRVAPLVPVVDDQSLKAKGRRSTKLQSKSPSTSSWSTQTKKPLDKEQMEPTRSSLQIFRDPPLGDLEEMWTLKRANPVHDSDDDRDELESPTKRIRSLELQDGDDEHRDDSVDRATRSTWLHSDDRVPDSNDGYVLSFQQRSAFL